MRHCYILLLTIVLFVSISCQRSVQWTVKGFGVDLSGIEYSVLEMDDEWLPNGDGNCFIRMQLNCSSMEQESKIREQIVQNGGRVLPLVEPYSYSHVRLNPYKGHHKGLYILHVDSVDVRDYSVLIYDELAKELLIIIEVQ